LKRFARKILSFTGQFMAAKEGLQDRYQLAEHQSLAKM
jgi:hypothetical protein